MNKFKTFPAKILLFGEHIINKGAHGLALPFHKYNCTLSFEKTEETLKESREVLELIHNQIENDTYLEPLFDGLQFHQDIIAEDLKINMNIPIGYGLGSSGAICAGVYDHYCHSKKKKPKKIQKILGKVESAFHGKSSGLDPIVSFLDIAVLVKENSTETIDFKLENVTAFHTFLVDTQQARKTAPLVEQFLNKYNTHSDFSAKVNNEIVPLTNDIIEDFISYQLANTYSKIKQLSKLQLENFKDLILDKHIPIWEKALKNDDFYLKICGAGGGGFMLGFCKDKAKVLEVFDMEEVIFV
jgi:mevalonate kinase